MLIECQMLWSLNRPTFLFAVSGPNSFGVRFFRFLLVRHGSPATSGHRLATASPTVESPKTTPSSLTRLPSEVDDLAASKRGDFSTTTSIDAEKNGREAGEGGDGDGSAFSGQVWWRLTSKLQVVSIASYSYI